MTNGPAWPGCVCMHAKNPTPPINPRQSIDGTTNSMIAVLKPGDSFILSPGMSTTCMAPFQPFWFDAFSPNQVFHIDRQETAIASWIRREEINRAAIDGRIPVEEYRAEMKEMERAWINRAKPFRVRTGRYLSTKTHCRQSTLSISGSILPRKIRLSRVEILPSRCGGKIKMPSWERIGGLPGKILIKNRPVQSQTAAQDGF